MKQVGEYTIWKEKNTRNIKLETTEGPEHIKETWPLPNDQINRHFIKTEPVVNAYNYSTVNRNTARVVNVYSSSARSDQLESDWTNMG